MNYFEERERNILGSKYDELYAHNKKPVRGITANVRKTNIENLLKIGIKGEPSQFCKNSLVLLEDDFKPGKHPYHHAGAYYVQEPSAAAPAALLDVEKGDYVLDLCAAPGGKSAQLGAQLGGTGLLVSNEIIPSRAAILKNNLQRMGFENCVVTNSKTSKIAESYCGLFNKILVDAPCSGEGMFYKEPQALLQHSERLVLSCSEMGEKILEDAAVALCGGGTLVYSTCTFSPNENELQIGKFLKRHSDFKLVNIDCKFGSPGEKIRCEGYNYNCDFTRRIYPSHGGEGHFMAKLIKHGEPSKQTLSERYDKKANTLFQMFLSEYFPKLISCLSYSINDRIFISPKYSLPDIKAINIISQGVSAGTVIKGRFEPEHALFMAYGRLCENKEIMTLLDERCPAFLKGEEIEALTAQNGYCAVLCDGMPIGFGKVSGGRIKNHYPKGLRNLN